MLISPIAIGHPNWSERARFVSLTKAQVEDSPDIDTELPVSRQHEIRHLRYYGYPYYWGGTGLWGAVDDPSMMLMTGYDGFVPTPRAQQTEAEEAYASAEAARHQNDDPHLRSCKAVTGYHIAIRSRTPTRIRSGTFTNIIGIPAIGRPMRNVNPMDPVRKPKRQRSTSNAR